MPDALVRPVAAIETLAQPKPEPLLAARALVQRSDELQATFSRAQEEGWPTDRLAVELEEPLQRDLGIPNAQEVVQVARYLADEFQQLGDTALLISRETGRAVGRLTEEDFWQPPPVPREGGGMAQPAKRLKPELEAALLVWHHERGREQQLLANAAPGLHQTALLREEGDRRLLPLTHAGRDHIVDQLRERLPYLLGTATGPIGHLLQRLDILVEDPKGTPFEPLVNCTAVARLVTGIQDMRALNLRYDRLTSLSMQIANTWGREIASTLARAAQDHFKPTPMSYLTLGDKDIEGTQVWVGTPDTVEALLRDIFPQRGVVLPIEGAPTAALLGGKIGAIVINPANYDCAGRELYGRWEIAARLEYTLWVDWTEIRAFKFTDVPITGVSIT